MDMVPVSYIRCTKVCVAPGSLSGINAVKS
jgi:hypothetical protein